VIVTMIGQHPELAGLPELKLFCYRSIGELEASLPTYWSERGFTHRSPGLVRALAQCKFGGQTPKRLAAARAWLQERAKWSGAEVLDVLHIQLSPRVAVEKSPETVNDWAALRRLARAYPNARYVHLTRHPATTADSMARHLHATLPDRAGGFDMTAGLTIWRDVHERILRFVASLPDDRAMRLKAEDVLNWPRERMRSVAQWLRLRDDGDAIEAMLHPEASPFAHLGPRRSGIVGGHDHKFLRDPIPHRVEVPSLFEPPPDWNSGPRAWRRIAALAEELGYRAAATPASRPRAAPLRAELLRRAGIDRKARLAYTGDPSDMARLMDIDADNTTWLEAVIERSGWPGRDRVGDEGAHAAWLIAQHADRSPDLQARFLEALKTAVARGQAAPADLAYLTDRVLLASGRKQEYGTQLAAHAGRYVAANLRAPTGADMRRAALGLEPLAQQIARAREQRAPARTVRRACPGCGKKIEVLAPALGRTTRYKCPNCGGSGTVRVRARTSEQIGEPQTA
jgi:predicted RNA-binding Zn-ribbon protein involved in translation (DUF1610 family)